MISYVLPCVCSVTRPLAAAPFMVALADLTFLTAQTLTSAAPAVDMSNPGQTMAPGGRMRVFHFNRSTLNLRKLYQKKIHNHFFSLFYKYIIKS